MSMNKKFDELVQGLDEAAFEALRNSVATEARERRASTAIRVEHIRPGMSDEAKYQAAQEIARVLRGEE